MLDHSLVEDKTLKADTMEILSKNKKIWSALRAFTATQHPFDVIAGTRPICQQPYRARRISRGVFWELKYVQLVAWIIEHTQSKWARPIELVPRKNGALQYCVNNRRLNVAMIPGEYFLPRIHDCFDSNGKAQMSTALNELGKYLKVPLKDESRNKIIFTSLFGTYLYTCVFLPYTTYLLHFNVHWVLSYLDSNERRVMLL